VPSKHPLTATDGGLAQYNVTYAMIERYYAAIQDQGLHSLSYFDIGNWGTRIKVRNTGARASRSISKIFPILHERTTGPPSRDYHVDGVKVPAPAGEAPKCGTRPDGSSAPCWDPAESASSQFLRDHLMAALLDNAWRDCCGFTSKFRCVFTPPPPFLTPDADADPDPPEPSGLAHAAAR
jgi:hypothetical protein